MHAQLPPLHDPFVDLVPPQGIKLTPRHYAYLKISEGCNHRCTFCIIPSLRGDLASRPIGDVLREAEHLVKAGVKELLVISQDTSAYGVDLKYATGFWGGKPRQGEASSTSRARSATLGAWVRLHYVYPYPHVDDVIPLMAEGKVLPYLDIPFQHGSPRVLKRMKRPAHAENTLERIRALARDLPRPHAAQHLHRRLPRRDRGRFRAAARLARARRSSTASAASSTRRSTGAAANALPDPVPDEVKEERCERFMERGRGDQRARSSLRKVGQRAARAGRRGRRGRRRHRPLGGRRARDRRRGAHCAARQELKAGDWADVRSPAPTTTT